jgi:hypothetical protein
MSGLSRGMITPPTTSNTCKMVDTITVQPLLVLAVPSTNVCSNMSVPSPITGTREEADPFSAYLTPTGDSGSRLPLPFIKP